MQTTPDFTDTQQAIIAHDEGPAAVVAGAGTGKTTVLAHRVRRLVDEKGLSPDDILVSSFGRATVDDLQSALARLGVPGVHTRTLHALGLMILRARREPPSSSPPENHDHSPAAQARILAQQALADVARDRGIEAADLGYNASELTDRIATWKQNLTYLPDAFTSLPPSAQTLAQKCTPEADDLIALFRRFEQLRHKRGWLTYADMVRSGWERLATDSSLRKTLQARYRFVLVDEYQDLSRAQVHMLDLLTASHRNYMVVGDEDQCIYGWRGADPSVLLNFRDRYDATEYRMTTSFRSPASALVLANAVIAQNDERRPTRLHCTRGLIGRTELCTPADTSAEATEIADRIDTLQANGIRLNNIAVLVRTYGQTPPLERAFLEHGLSYRLTGAAPFYERPPVRTLLQYLYWALLERQRRRTGWFSSEQRASRYADRFAQIVKQPTRYIPHRRIRRIAHQVQRNHTSALDCLRSHQSALPTHTAEKIDNFVSTAKGLIDRLDETPDALLEWLMDALDYTSHLRETSASSRFADARIRAVEGLVQYARHHKTTHALLDEIRSLAAQQEARDSYKPAIDLRSIHRAKGREWPVVLVPGCINGTLPLSSNGDTAPSTEDERRLLYVALTRARRHLLISSPADAQRSPFLTEASAETKIEAARTVRTGLTTEPDALSDQELVSLCQNIAALNLTSYIRSWWRPPDDQRAALRERLDRLSPAIASAQRRRQAYRQRQAEWTFHHLKSVAQERDRLRSFQDQIGTAPIAATCEASEVSLPDDAALTFSWNESDAEVSILWNEHQVGFVAPLAPHRLDAQTALTLPWSFLVGRVDRVRPKRQTLTFRIDWTASAHRVDTQVDGPSSPPDSPSDRTRVLCDDEFRAGYDALQDALQSHS